ncbi:MAG TPA: amidohydrolase family protein [Planctomycetota bacterium]|nr:amidohydrolase family protein [Planctomycetota bacterium]
MRPRRSSALAALLLAGVAATAPGLAIAYETHDSHFHLTNYVQHGPSLRDFLATMGDRVGRVAVFGIPLQQTWSYENSGEFAPTYYLHSDAPLYYYSFTDAWIAKEFLSLSKRERTRFDPMITGFNPADMYATDHIRRVLETFPGVFSGIGEFTIHKEFVSSKVAGDVASLTDPALDRIFAFAGKVGLVVLLHNDIDVPFSKEEEPVYLNQMKALLARHPGTTIIWAHTGLGRVIHPQRTQAAAGSAERSTTHIEILLEMLEDPALDHLLFDLSWDEVAKYVLSSQEATQRTARMIEAYPDRFLFGTDEVAPRTQEAYLRVYEQYGPLFEALRPETREKLRKGNYERIFDAARKNVRAWEKANVK